MENIDIQILKALNRKIDTMGTGGKIPAGWTKQNYTQEELLTLPIDNILGKYELVKVCKSEDKEKIYYLEFKQFENVLIESCNAGALGRFEDIDDASSLHYYGKVVLCVPNDDNTIDGKVKLDKLELIKGAREGIFLPIEMYTQGYASSGLGDMYAGIINNETVNIINKYQENKSQPCSKVTIKPEYMETITKEDRTLYIIKSKAISDKLEANLGESLDDMRPDKAYYIGQANHHNNNASYIGLGGTGWTYKDIDFMQ